MNLIRILPLVFTVAVLHAASFKTPDDWAFGIEFPFQPKISTKRPPGEVLQTTAACDARSSAFIARRDEYFGDIPKQNIVAVYDGSRDMLLKAMSANLLSEEKVTIGGYEGRRYVIESNDRTKRGECRIFLVGNELYQFMFATNDALGTKEAVKFFGSIEAREKRADLPAKQ
jgi:hypothetical protein